MEFCTEVLSLDWHVQCYLYFLRRYNTMQNVELLSLKMNELFGMVGVYYLDHLPWKNDSPNFENDLVLLNLVVFYGMSWYGQ